MNVQGAGGLPDYICRIARAIKRSGKTTSQAISIAVSRVKVWATGKGVDKDTQAKAAEAVAAWEALRAKSHAKAGAKKAGKTVKASNRDGEILCLANTSFNTDMVRKAWNATANRWEAGGSFDSDVMSGPSYGFRADAYIRELWTDYLIVEASDGDLFKVNYEVGDPDSDGDIDVSFDDPIPVQVDYVEMSAADMVGYEIRDADLLRAVALTPACQFSAVEQVLMTCAPRHESALERVLALAADKETGRQYGDVQYADTKNKKYPVDTAKHVRAAWSYFNQGDNQKGYSPAEIAAIKSRIKSAAKKFNIEISD